MKKIKICFMTFLFLIMFGILTHTGIKILNWEECEYIPKINFNVIEVEIEKQVKPEDISYLISLRSDIGEETRIKIAKCIVNSAIRYDIDPILLTSLIDIESEWNFKATSPKGAKGLTQIMIDQHSKLLEVRCIDESKIYDIDVNIDLGAQILAFCSQKFEDVNLVLASYNAGIGTIGRFNDIPPYKETINYVKNVLAMYGYMTIMLKES